MVQQMIERLRVHIADAYRRANGNESSYDQGYADGLRYVVQHELADLLPQGSIPQVLAEAERLLAGITPDDGKMKRVRYDHGGGRMFRAVPRETGIAWHDDEDRTLVIDAYQEGDREFYFNAARLVRELLTALRSLPPQTTEKKEV